ncbi:MAG TPA: xanthine dehydrogenase family protein subunit M [Candidatus Acidoferrales bacterium]|jgi:xanthine dehydrogenase YagS FAD-binding subunit
MDTFQYTKPATVNDAMTGAAASGAKFVAGGTTLIDLMKLNVERPTALVDINILPLDRIEPEAGGGLKIGAMVRNSDLAHDSRVQQMYPVLSEALLSGASPQLRNMATTGGNLLQRTRCYYFRDTNYACNKREPGSGCPAIEGFNRIHAILGTSEHCIATHPSDMAVAMMALGATIHLNGSAGERNVPITEFYLLPGNTPDHENVVRKGEIITHVTLPALPANTKSHYLKRRDRASYEFALASAAVIVDMDGNKIRKAQIALGGVGTRPWRSLEAEKELAGRDVNERTFRNAAEAALHGAKTYRNNGFKVELAKRTLVRALQTVTASA